MSEIRALLEGIRDGSVSVDDAMLQLKQQPFADIGYAKVDMHRKLRQGAGEVIYGAGKTAGQIIGILKAMAENGQSNVLITRLDAQKARAVDCRGLLLQVLHHRLSEIQIPGLPLQDGGEANHHERRPRLGARDNKLIPKAWVIGVRP